MPRQRIRRTRKRRMVGGSLQAPPFGGGDLEKPPFSGGTEMTVAIPEFENSNDMCKCGDIKSRGKIPGAHILPLAKHGTQEEFNALLEVSSPSFIKKLKEIVAILESNEVIPEQHAENVDMFLNSNSKEEEREALQGSGFGSFLKDTLGTIGDTVSKVAPAVLPFLI